MRCARQSGYLLPCCLFGIFNSNAGGENMNLNQIHALVERYNRVFTEFCLATGKRHSYYASNQIAYVGRGWYRGGNEQSSFRYRADWVRSRIASMEADTVAACQDAIRDRADRAPYPSDLDSYKTLLRVANGLPRALRQQVLAFHSAT